MTMTVSELIARLEECDPDATVLLAHQPSWPLQFQVRGVAESADLVDPDDVPAGPCPDHDREDCTECLAAQAGPSVVYIVEGSHPDRPYAPRGAWDVAR